MSGKTRWFEGVGLVLKSIFLFVLTVCAIGAILLTLTHITLTFGKTPYWLIEWFPNQVLGWFGTDSAKLIADNIYETIIADMIAICAFVFAVVPAIQAGIYKIDLKYKLRKAHGLEVFKVKQEGIDDLAKMLECYQGADHITVFCGDFDWLQPSNIKNNDKYKSFSKRHKKKLEKKAKQMKDFVVNSATEKKITLVSSKTIDLVKEGLRDNGNLSLTGNGKDALFKSLEKRFIFGIDIGFKCSLIRHLNDTYAFLYRSHTDAHDHSFNAHIFTGATEGEELINILRNLIESGKWETRAGEHITSPDSTEPA